MTNILLAWVMVWTYATWAELKKSKLTGYWPLILDLIFALLFLIAVVVTVRPSLLPA